MEDTDEKMNESRTFVELTNDITKAVESGINLFKLTELHSLYIGRLKELGVEKQVNKTRLKCSLLQMCKSKSALLTTLQMQMLLRLVYKLSPLTNHLV